MKVVKGRTQLGKFLAHMRIETEETHRQMSERLGVSTHTLTNIEYGKFKKPFPEKYKQLIAEKYNVDMIAINVMLESSECKCGNNCGGVCNHE